jgi:hypothetical protein
MTERDVVKEIETLIMGKTAPKDRRLEWLLLYLAGSEIRALRLLCETLREQLIAEGIKPLVAKYEPLEGVSIIPGTDASATADSPSSGVTNE